MLVLDTDHISVLGYGIPAGLRLAERLNASGDDAVTTVISLEEQMRGWLAEINRISDVGGQITAYDRLRTRTEFMAEWVMLRWDEESAGHFRAFRSEGIRIGTMDLKIACIALAHDGTVLSRNLTDFRQVPGLRVENWLD
jgi:tRNA(fMet)-specific endonuclease VapC